MKPRRTRPCPARPPARRHTGGTCHERHDRSPPPVRDALAGRGIRIVSKTLEAVVAAVVKNLPLDLRRRATHIGSSPIKASPPSLPAIADQYRQRILRLLGKARQQIEDLSSDPDLLDPLYI